MRQRYLMATRQSRSTSFRPPEGCRAGTGGTRDAHRLTMPSGGNGRRLGPGDVLADRYVLGRQLGCGGSSHVFAAADTLVGEEVAIKIMAPLRHRSAIARFRREVQLARRICHPHVCRLHEIGMERLRGPDGTESFLPFFVMDLLPGETVRERIQRTGPLPLPLVHRVARQLARALAAIHAAGVVHRDLKSANVVLSGPGRAVVIDFGHADTAELPSAPGYLVGSPAYMAPEQALGMPATPASDVYAFGTILYEMATGSLPYGRDTSVPIVVCKQVGAPYAPARERRADLPVALSALIDSCLATQPERRHRDGTALVRALGPAPRPLAWLRRALESRRRVADM